MKHFSMHGDSHGPIPFTEAALKTLREPRQAPAERRPVPAYKARKLRAAVRAAKRANYYANMYGKGM